MESWSYFSLSKDHKLHYLKNAIRKLKVERVRLKPLGLLVARPIEGVTPTIGHLWLRLRWLMSAECE